VIDPAQVIAALQQLKGRTESEPVFGANAHEFVLDPPVPVAEIEAFEQEHQIRLPEDYRHFITTIGNGGAGPAYGVFRFGEQDDGHDFCTWSEGYLLGDVSQPFPHSDTWNLPPAFWDEEPDPPEGTSQEEEDKLWEAWDQKIESQYWSPSIMNGAIPICHLGCALRQWLVVNGECKGQVWSDDRADHGGVYPALDANGKRHTFESWYLAWLGEALGK
jgi:hypothetical protein